MEELDQYDYKLPPELIAQTPLQPRDAARLMVFNRKTGQVVLTRFSHLADYLPNGAVVVFNQTKVIPARLVLKRQSGGSVSVLYLKIANGLIEVLANRPLKEGEVLFHEQNELFAVGSRQNNHYLLKPFFPIDKVNEILNRLGVTPLPPYIKDSPLSEKERRKEYQTVFAKEEGSVAAPTASLHFTPKLLKELEIRGVELAYVTLHVGLGTFAPLKLEQLEKGELHEEFFSIDAVTQERLNQAKATGRPIISVGTTVARVLESDWSKASTKIFIRPGYKFKYVNSLITNFHVPRSSLLMLVASLVGVSKLQQLYQQAIAEKFRFYSFGDGMFII